MPISGVQAVDRKIQGLALSKIVPGLVFADAQIELETMHNIE